MDYEEDLDLKAFNIPNAEFGIDQIFQIESKRVNKALATIKPDLMKVGAKLFEKNSHPNLQTLVHNTYLRMAKDLAWLEQKTNTFENPAEKRLEELRRICILNDINNPIIGEDLYDPKKPDTTRQKMQFRNMIRK